MRIRITNLAELEEVLPDELKNEYYQIRQESRVSEEQLFLIFLQTPAFFSCMLNWTEQHDHVSLCGVQMAFHRCDIAKMGLTEAQVKRSYDRFVRKLPRKPEYMGKRGLGWLQMEFPLEEGIEFDGLPWKEEISEAFLLANGWMGFRTERTDRYEGEPYRALLADETGQVVDAHLEYGIADWTEVYLNWKAEQEEKIRKQHMTVAERYSRALDLLDAYDHQTLEMPAGRRDTYRLTYEECRTVIDGMKFGAESDLFGNEKDDSFRGSLGAIYQTFGGEELYPSLEEKAAALLYFVTKNHSFSDGNKRIAAAIFLYFLDRNGALFENDEKRLDDAALAALTIMTAQSRPEDKDMMLRVIGNCLVRE